MSKRDIEQAVERLTVAGSAYVIATVVRTEAPTSAKAGDRAIIEEDGHLTGWVGGGCALPAVKRNAAAALASGQSRLIRISRNLEDLDAGIIGFPMSCPSGGTLDIFIEPVMPRAQFVIVGKTAIAKALCRLASTLGFDVVVAAPEARREEFAEASDWLEDLDDVAKLTSPPTAVVVATQGAGDARGLEAALACRPAYIGFIASPTKSRRVKENLRKRGADAAAIEAIDAPAGIYIGAATPEEVAVSILAELIRRRRLEDRGEDTAENEQSRVS